MTSTRRILAALLAAIALLAGGLAVGSSATAAPMPTVACCR